MNDPAQARAPGRQRFLLLASLFIVPVAAAAWLYFSSGWRPGAGAAHGELIDPARPLAEYAFTLPGGGTAPRAVLRGSWFLVLLEDADCRADCEAALEELSRVRLALGKDAPRVRRVLLHAGDCCARPFPAADDGKLLILGVGGESGRAWRAQFPRASDGSAGIYIVDPHGNLVMRHDGPDAAPGLLKDLERLLRLSRIG